MKTNPFSPICLSLLILLTACGKKANEEEGTPVFNQKTTAASDEKTEVDLKNSILTNDLEEFKNVVKDNQLDLAETKIEGETPLISAIKNNAVNVIDYLLERGVNLEETGNKGETPLMAAVSSNQEQSVLLLVRNKVRLDRKNEDGETALHLALKKGLENIALLLIQHGANIKITDMDNFSPYDLAVEKKLKKAEEVLRKMMQVEFGAPDLHSFRDAIVSGDVSTLAVMLRKFPSLGLTYEMINPLALTMNLKSENTGLQMANLLLVNQTSVNGPRDAEYSPLVRAAIMNKLNFVDLLLTNKADPNLLDKEGRSALYHATGHNALDMVELLLARGAKGEYSFKRDGKKIKVEVCDVARDVEKKMKKKKDKEGQATAKSIKKALDCGFWDIFD